MSGRRWSVLTIIEIPDLDRPEINYLWRMRIIRTPWFGLYLHRFDAPDSRPTLHDHPWWFASVVLRGGYVERVPKGDRHETEPQLAPVRRHIRRFNFKRATDLHYIESLDRTPTWTFMLTGRSVRESGYWDHDGWTRIDQHPRNDEFIAALAARSTAPPVGGGR